MTSFLRPLQAGLAALSAIALVSCGDTDPGTDETDPVVNSKVLEGSISDDMIEYDTLRSQAPPAQVEPEDTESSGTGGSGDTGSLAPDTEDEEETSSAPDEAD